MRDPKRPPELGRFRRFKEAVGSGDHDRGVILRSKVSIVLALFALETPPRMWILLVLEL